MRIKNSPYNLRETLGYFKRNYLGPVTKNRGLVSYCPQQLELNRGVQRQLKIAFIGDIMDMAGRHLQMGEGIKHFVSDCDYLAGNFEATITDAKGAYMAQRHIPQILDALADLFLPEKTFLGLANNHSGDFGHQIWSLSKTQIEEKGFQVFGFDEKPFVDIGQGVRIVGATQWSNQPIDYIPGLNEISHYHQPDRFNILYPHWGYELELFPRPELVQSGNDLSSIFNAIIGHHSHIPQAITVTPVNRQEGPVNQVIAYGLGDFCIFEKLKHYLYGQVVKLTVGLQDDHNWMAGSLEWRFTTCQPIDDKNWKTDITESFPYPMA